MKYILWDGAYSFSYEGGLNLVYQAYEEKRT